MVNNNQQALADYEALMQERIYEAAERSLYVFIKAAWQYMSNKPISDNWHLGCLCEHLQEFLKKKSSLPRNMIINIPPRHTKTLIATVGSTAWQYIQDPRWQVIHITHSSGLYMENIDNIRGLINEPWYANRWCNPENPATYKFSLSKTKNTGEWFKLEEGGEFFASTPRSAKVTGHGADIQILDDPSDANSASPTELEKVNSFYKTVLPSRFDDQSEGKFLIVQQRLGENDLSGYILDNERENVFHLNLPMLFNSKKTFWSPIGFHDRRKKDGEVLDPVRFPPDVVANLRAKSGLTTWSTQYQQEPLTEGGNLLQTGWFQYYSELPHIDTYYTCWDFALKEGENNDYTVGLLMGKSGTSFYVLDIKREKADTPRQLDMIREYDNAYPHIVKHLVEGGNGDPIASMLKREIGNFEILLPRTYGGSKENRVRATIPLFLENRVFLPMQAEWLGDFVQELTAFPRGKHDDQLDSLVYALLWGVQYDSTSSVYIGLHGTQTPFSIEEKARQQSQLNYDWQKERADVVGTTTRSNIRSIFQ